MGTDATALERQVTSSASLNLCKHRVAMATLQPRDAMAADSMGASRARGPEWMVVGPGRPGDWVGLVGEERAASSRLSW